MLDSDIIPKDRETAYERKWTCWKCGPGGPIANNLLHLTLKFFILNFQWIFSGVVLRVFCLLLHRVSFAFNRSRTKQNSAGVLPEDLSSSSGQGNNLEESSFVMQVSGKRDVMPKIIITAICIHDFIFRWFYCCYKQQFKLIVYRNTVLLLQRLQ